MNIFEQAVRQQTRFDFNGQINIEQLYNARITSKFKEDLISYEEDLAKQVESFGKSLRRNSIEKTKLQKETELKLSIITAFLDEIEVNEKEAKEKADKAERKQELLALKRDKQKINDANLSIEDIDKELLEL